jgi:regulation of enolase protein 1 (concanavalin A-like superfamily)
MPTLALERQCDTSFEDCRAPLLDLINNETVGIDVAFWFMEDARYSAAIIRRFQAGVPVRVLFDDDALRNEPVRQQIIADLKAAGIPMRYKSSGGILHWKMMLFAGQATVEFSGANFSSEAFVPISPYQNYVDESIYFTDIPSIVDSFKTKYDDNWTSSTDFTNYANITSLVRTYPTFPIDSRLNFPPKQSFRSRSVNAYNAETTGVDSIMYRITDRAHADALIAARGRGVAVRLITEPDQYRDASRLWHAWNVDRMYMAGVQIRHRHHQGLTHEKLTMLQGQGMTIYGSSNWTSPSSDSQIEHNLFTTDPVFFQWGEDQFNRKWNNTGPSQETEPFVPLPPDTPVLKVPANAATAQPTTLTLKWYAGPWAHKYDVYLGTDPSNLTKIVSDNELGPSQSATDYVTWTLSGLAAGTTYYWQVTGRTMANLEKTSDIFSFTTEGTGPGGGPLPSGWSDTDIGNVSIGGSATYDSGTYTVRASGTDIWGTSDEFHFVYRTLSGDGTITARVASVSNTDVWVKAGVMMRATLAADAAHASMFVTPAKGLAFQRRTATGGETTNTSGGSGTAPMWVRMVRSGNMFSAYVSSNGTAWTLVGTDTIAMGSTIYVGLPLTNHDDSALATATYDNVTVDSSSTSTLPSGWSNGDVGAVGAAGTASFSGGTFTLTGSGADIWDTSDEFQFAYTSLAGNGSITARVATVSNTDDWTKAGVMMRASLAANAAQASMFVTPGKGLAFQRRTTSGGTSTNTSGGSGTAPKWVRLVRNGSAVTAYVSNDGSSWTLVGSDTIGLDATIDVGLALTSHVDGTVATATFDNVTVSTSSTSSLPSGWSNSDVGAVGAAGSASESAGTFTVTGSGADIWDTADEFQFAYTSLTGDGSIVARVASVQNVASWTKAAVMMRASLAAGSRHAMMLVSPGKGFAFQRRVTDGGLSTNTSGGSGTAPEWVKLTRAGSTITASISADGVSWTVVGTDTISMPSAIDVGLAVSSHVDGTLATATFDHVTVGP